MVKIALKILALLCVCLHPAMLRATEKNFVLITSLYNERDPERLSEYISCFMRNSQNRYIRKIHVIYDTANDVAGRNLLLDFLKKKNATITLHQGRPSFQYIFDLANKLYPNKRVIVSNADIYFNETLSSLDNFDLNNFFIALTRWEHKGDGFLRPMILSNGSAAPFSHDTWIFQTPLAVQNANVQLGTYHCEHPLLGEAEKAGLKLLNPCLSIICCHLHMSGKRNYTVTPPPDKVYHLPWCYLPITK